MSQLVDRNVQYTMTEWSQKWISLSFLRKLRGQHRKTLSVCFLVVTLTITLTSIMLSGKWPTHMEVEDVTSSNNQINRRRINNKEEYSRKLFQAADYSDPKSILMKDSNENPEPVPESNYLVGAGKVGLQEQSTELNGYKDSWEPLVESDSPVFWHIPKAGGSTFKDIMGSCYRFILASEAGILEGHANDTVSSLVFRFFFYSLYKVLFSSFNNYLFSMIFQDLAIVDIGGDTMNEPSKFVNVDTTHIPGLEKAKRLGLVESGLAEVIVIRHVFDAEQLFNQQQRGRLFAVFRHPLERAVSMFNYLKKGMYRSRSNTKFYSSNCNMYTYHVPFPFCFLVTCLDSQPFVWFG
jgi:hypothetical protein